MRRLLGDDVDPALRPLLIVRLLVGIGGSAVYSFIGIWAIEELGARAGQLSVAYVGAAVGGVLAGYAGGHLSDRVGRRPVILVATGGHAMAGLLYLAAGKSLALALAAFLVLAVCHSLGQAADQALVTDLVPPEGRERAFAALRVVQNLGVTTGPLVGGLLLLGDSWSRLFLGSAAVAGAGWLLAWRLIPARGAHAPAGPPARGSLAVIRRDRVFLAFCGGMALAWIVYMSYETLLPISLTQAHGIDKSTWGLLLALNPLTVTLFQLRVTRGTAGLPLGPKLIVALLLMGLPYSFLAVSDAVPVAAVLILLFVVGEMLWVPASQAVVARLAPDDLRGAYLGAFGGTSSIGLALAPLIGLQTAEAFGDAWMWAFVAGVALLGAAVLGAVCRLPAVRGPARTDPRLAAVAAE